MASRNQSHPKKKSLFPFCAGLGCGILLSMILFFPFTSRFLYSHLVRDSHSVDVKHVAFDYRDDPAMRGIRELIPDESLNSVYDNRTIPIEVEMDPIVEESLDWDLNIASPARIPAFLSQELKLKRKLFVGIINPTPLTFRIAKLIPTTWGESWPIEGSGELTFYSAMGIDMLEKESHFNYMTLSGLSHSDLPTPHMVYQVLRDICGQHIDTHHFYFVGNGNAYVSLPDLLNFTMHMNESDAMWIGHGTYMPVQQRYYKNDPEFFCHAGPGFVLSRRSMQGVCPHLHTCEKLYNHDDEKPGYELARCFRRFLNINCTRSLEARSLFFTSDNLPEPYSPSRPFANSLAIHPVPDETTLYVLHQYALERQLNYTLEVNEYYHSIIQNMDRVLVKEGGMPDDRLVLGRDGNANKYHHADIVAWDRIEAAGLYAPTKNMVITVEDATPSRAAAGHDYIALSDIREIALNHVLTNYISEDEIESDVDRGTVFRRVVPGVGFQYMVDIKRDNKEFATVCINQPYERVMMYGTRSAPNVKINFILPMQEGSPYFREFMQMFEQACMSADQPNNVGLLVVLYSSGKDNETVDKVPDEKTSQALSLLNLYKQKYPKLSLRWINAASPTFSHIKAVEMAVLALPTETLFCAVRLDNQMSPEFLHHVRLNTVPHESIFFPASFQFYRDAVPESDRVSADSGFWRSFDYDTFCGYKHDIMQASGGDKFKSGRDLFKKAFQYGLDTFRSPEYALRTKWHERDCDSAWLDGDERIVCMEERKYTNLAVSAASFR